MARYQQIGQRDFSDLSVPSDPQLVRSARHGKPCASVALLVRVVQEAARGQVLTASRQARDDLAQHCDLASFGRPLRPNGRVDPIPLSLD